MKKIILGLVAAAAVAAPIALTAGSASADTPSGSTCTPSAATPAVTHTEYQWAALVAKGGLHWDYKWTATPKNPTTDILHVWVKSLDLSKQRPAADHEHRRGHPGQGRGDLLRHAAHALRG